MMEMSVPTSARPQCKLAWIILATGNGLDMHAAKRQVDSVESALVQTRVPMLVSGRVSQAAQATLTASNSFFSKCQQLLALAKI